jgi:aconitate decarboxylase
MRHTTARFAAKTTFADIPADIIERIKFSCIDGLGVCLQGSTLPWTQKVYEIVRDEGGKPLASVGGTGHRTSLTNAVMVNSTAGHAFEMDDIHKESIVHPNSLAVPIALALAEADQSIAGRDIAAALVVGYEVGLRIGNAATTSLFLNGFHPQGTSGAFVAVVTAGRLLQLDVEAMQNALGIAGSMGAGLMAAQEGAMAKRLHAGRAAQVGLMAALLARRGFTGISDVVEAGNGGFLSAFSRTPNPALPTQDRPEWQAAAEALLLVAERGGSTGPALSAPGSKKVSHPQEQHTTLTRWQTAKYRAPLGPPPLRIKTYDCPSTH